jgi:phenolic acid decarboxylase
MNCTEKTYDLQQFVVFDYIYTYLNGWQQDIYIQATLAKLNQIFVRDPQGTI